jgi:hypothetical protein
MMKKQSIQTLLLAFTSLLLLVTANVRSLAQERPADATVHEFQTLSGVIRWKKELGVVPKAPYSNEAAGEICSPFYVGVIVDAQSAEGLTVYTNSLERGPDQGDMYICRYTIEKVPANKNLHLVVGMGDPSPTPKILPFQYVGPWVGEDGSKPAPPRRSIRGFAQNNKYLRIGSVKGTYVAIDLVYKTRY